MKEDQFKALAEKLREYLKAEFPDIQEYVIGLASPENDNVMLVVQASPMTVANIVDALLHQAPEAGQLLAMQKAEEMMESLGGKAGGNESPALGLNPQDTVHIAHMGMPKIIK